MNFCKILTNLTYAIYLPYIYLIHTYPIPTYLPSTFPIPTRRSEVLVKSLTKVVIEIYEAVEDKYIGEPLGSTYHKTNRRSGLLPQYHPLNSLYRIE